MNTQIIIYIFLFAVLFYAAGKLICLGKNNCIFSVFNIGNINQSGKGDKNDK